MVEQSRVFSMADFLPLPCFQQSADPTGPCPAHPDQPFPLGGNAVPEPRRLIKTHQEGDVQLAAEETPPRRTGVNVHLLPRVNKLPYAPPGRAPSLKPTSPTPPKPLQHLSNLSRTSPTPPKPLQPLQNLSNTSPTF